MPKPKRKYKGHYYRSTRRAFTEFKEGGDLIKLVKSLCSVADTSVRYEWQMEVLEREIDTAFNEIIGDNLVIFTGGN